MDMKKLKEKLLLVGGGIGIAPLYLVAKNIENCDAYLEFRKEPILEEEYKEVCNEVHIAAGSICNRYIRR